MIRLISVVLLISSLCLCVIAQEDSVIMLDLNQIIDSAIQNHPEIKNAEIKIITAKSMSVFDFKPLEIDYENGQRFSTSTDSRLEIRQNFGSPFLWTVNASQKQSIIKTNEAEAELRKAKIFKDIKSAFYQCLYELNRIELYKKQRAVFYELSTNVDTNLNNEDSFQIELAIAELKFSNVLNEANLAYNDYYLAKNSLNKACLIQSDFEVKYTPLVMFSMIPPSDTFNRTPANLFLNVYKNYSAVADNKVQIEKLRFLPEISAGYFNQSISKAKNFSGWQVGISIPILFFPQESKRKEAVANKKIADNDYELQKMYVQNTSENLLIKLNKYFEQLNYFYDFALQQADLLESSSLKIAKSNPAMFIKCLDGVISAYSIKMDYLKVLNDYNQAAIELELYAY